MASYLLADNAPLGGVAGSPREWVLIPAYSEKCRRQFRGKVGSDGFEKVLIGMRGARETFFTGTERTSGEEQRSDERRKTA